jgi:hypothetical protein
LHKEQEKQSYPQIVSLKVICFGPFQILVLPQSLLNFNPQNKRGRVRKEEQALDTDGQNDEARTKPKEEH